jgi:hypothetical protein
MSPRRRRRRRCLPAQMDQARCWFLNEGRVDASSVEPNLPSSPLVTFLRRTPGAGWGVTVPARCLSPLSSPSPPSTRSLPPSAPLRRLGDCGRKHSPLGGGGGMRRASSAAAVSSPGCEPPAGLPRGGRGCNLMVSSLPSTPALAAPPPGCPMPAPPPPLPVPTMAEAVDGLRGGGGLRCRSLSLPPPPADCGCGSAPLAASASSTG